MFKSKFLTLQLIILLGFFIPTNTYAAETALGEAENFWELVSLVWTWGLKVILPLSILTMIVAWFMYISSEGDEEKLSQAKQISRGSIISVTILLFSGVLKNFLQKPLQDIDSGDATLNSLPNVIQNTSNLLLTFVWGFAVFILVYNGIQYMVAAGDPEKIDKAKRQTRYAIIGLLMAVLAYYLIDFVIGFWVG